MPPPATTSSRDLAADLTYLTRALKVPTLPESVARFAERARAGSWTHEECMSVLDFRIQSPLQEMDGGLAPPLV